MAEAKSGLTGFVPTRNAVAAITCAIFILVALVPMAAASSPSGSVALSVMDLLDELESSNTSVAPEIWSSKVNAPSPST